MSMPGDNAAKTSRPVAYANQEEWDAFYKLPKPIRDVLIEAPFDYSSVEVLRAYDTLLSEREDLGMFSNLVRGRDHSSAIPRMIGMIHQNIAMDMKEYREKLAGVPRKH